VDKVNGSADRKEEQKSMERFKVSPCGRYVGLVGTSRKGGGMINVLDSGTAQWIAQVRVDGRGGVADFAWWSNGEGMTVASKNGEVSEWDGRQRRIIARWLDAGAVGNTVIALGGHSGRDQLGGDRWVAIGSTSGIVNIYDRREWAAAAAAAGAKSNVPVQDDSTQAGVPRSPTPTRVFDQLTTPVSHLVFAPDGQMMVMASRWKRDALRLGMYSTTQYPPPRYLIGICLNIQLTVSYSAPPILHRLPQLAHLQHSARPYLIRGHLAEQ
jgi:U3 small nucleolar RNA-associated protein 18